MGTPRGRTRRKRSETRTLLGSLPVHEDHGLPVGRPWDRTGPDRTGARLVGRSDRPRSVGPSLWMTGRRSRCELAKIVRTCGTDRDAPSPNDQHSTSTRPAQSNVSGSARGDADDLRRPWHRHETSPAAYAAGWLRCSWPPGARLGRPHPTPPRHVPSTASSSATPTASPSRHDDDHEAHPDGRPGDRQDPRRRPPRNDRRGGRLRQVLLQQLNDAFRDADPDVCVGSPVPPARCAPSLGPRRNPTYGLRQPLRRSIVKVNSSHRE